MLDGVAPHLSRGWIPANQERVNACPERLPSRTVPPMESRWGGRPGAFGPMIVRPIAEGVEVLAPAKLNLFLEILGRRSDGYHEIESLMVAVDLNDTLHFVV